MKIEEAIKILEQRFDSSCRNNLFQNVEKLDYEDALWMAISALRSATREQLEKAWRGEWQMVSNGSGVCSECHRQDKIDPLAKFCRYCGTPLTDEAVEMVMERLEKLKNGKL